MNPQRKTFLERLYEVDKAKYVALIKKVDKAFADGAHTIRVTWDVEYTKEQWIRYKHSELDCRINERGNLDSDCVCSVCRNHDKFWDYSRDQRRLHEHIRNNVVIDSFSTNTVRKRFGHLINSDYLEKESVSSDGPVYFMYGMEGMGDLQIKSEK